MSILIISILGFLQSSCIGFFILFSTCILLALAILAPYIVPILALLLSFTMSIPAFLLLYIISGLVFLLSYAISASALCYLILYL